MNFDTSDSESLLEASMLGFFSSDLRGVARELWPDLGEKIVVD